MAGTTATGKISKGLKEVAVEEVMALKTQGMSNKNIAEIYGVSESAVTQYCKKNHITIKAPNGKKAENIDLEEFKKLYYLGMSDSAIAKRMGFSRHKIINVRQSLSLPPNLTVGKRGIGKLRDDANMLSESKRVLKHSDFRYVLSEAIIKYLEIIRDEPEEIRKDLEITAWATTIIEPHPIIHPIPGDFSANIEKTNITHVKYATKVEKTSDLTGICGVPSPELLELLIEARGKNGLADKLIEIINKSGYVGTHETVGQVRGRMSPDPVYTWNDIWNHNESKAIEWAPVKKEIRPRIKGGYSEKRRYDGRKGSMGGSQNIAVRRAYAGAKGY